MSRAVLVIGDAISNEGAAAAALSGFGVESVAHAPDVTAGLQLISLGHIDVVFVAVDGLSDAALAQLDRGVRLASRTEVIGTAERAEPEVMLRAMRAGIQEFLVRPVNAAELTAALDRVGRRHAPAVSGLVFACYGTKGGIGVSSVAANLGSALASAGHRVAIMDLVLPNGEQRLQFNASAPYDIRDLASKPDRMDQELLNSVLSPIRDGLWLLASSEDPEVDDIVDAGVTNSILQQLRTSFHYTVVDCARQLDDRTLAVLDSADRIVVITQLNVAALRSTQRALSIFRRLGYPEEKLNVVVNRYQSGEVISLSDATDVLKAPVFFKLPNDYKVMAEAITRGVPAAQIDAGSRIATAFSTLAANLTGSSGRNGTSRNGKPAGGLRGLFTRKK
jgi:pilus assembly protein CpaE